MIVRSTGTDTSRNCFRSFITCVSTRYTGPFGQVGPTGLARSTEATVVVVRDSRQPGCPVHDLRGEEMPVAVDSMRTGHAAARESAGDRTPAPVRAGPADSLPRQGTRTGHDDGASTVATSRDGRVNSERTYGPDTPVMDHSRASLALDSDSG